MKIDFYLRFTTRFGQSLFISGDIEALGNKQHDSTLQMNYLSEEFWHASIDVQEEEEQELNYRYIFKDEQGGFTLDEEKKRCIIPSGKNIVVIDTWNFAGDPFNSFYTKPFKKVFYKEAKKSKIKKGVHSHVFKVKAPLLQANETVCLIGSNNELGQWDTVSPMLMHKEGDWWVSYVDLTGSATPIAYKYGVYNTTTKAFLGFEEGENRTFYVNHDKGTETIVHDNFIRWQIRKWKGAGVAIPVFSLRSKESFGIGEFNDIKLLADWAEKTGLTLIQLLPVNDTTATATWKDSYPYAAISAFALHPIYINLQKVAGKHADVLKSLARKKKQLNDLPEIDYESVLHFKINTLKELYEADGGVFLKQDEYKEFFSTNKHWLAPYAAFCFYRDKYNTADFTQWKLNSVYKQAEIDRLCSSRSKQFKAVAFWLYVQYHLHLQLKEAVAYAHKKGIAIKGDIAIGVARNSADAWTNPSLYNMEMQAGAPPDDFAVKGQNWGFPTYNWQKMQEDHFNWWRLRFEQMGHYFDAFRIDHILGFFRIWSIPQHAVEGILGRFVPAIGLTDQEFAERSVWFDYERFCTPFVTDEIVSEAFGEHATFVKTFFLQPKNDLYMLKQEFATQKAVADYFDRQEDSIENKWIKQGLFDLIANVILLEEEGKEKRYHFRINMENTSSYQHLDDYLKHKLKELYIHYFYYRQDAFWKKEAMSKLPALKDATDMLICGEDLGMVPHCVPDVMQQLGILSLEIQRMPKDSNTEFFHPQRAPYLSVITPSTHDMSCIRAWWEEDKSKAQRFYNSLLDEQGEAPASCEPWINRAIVMQHLYAPAMWSVFQLQDILGMSSELRRENASEDRINVPAISNYYWRYRMHVPLESLIKEKEFNHGLKEMVEKSGR